MESKTVNYFCSKCGKELNDPIYFYCSGEYRCSRCAKEPCTVLMTWVRDLRYPTIDEQRKNKMTNKEGGVTSDLVMRDISGEAWREYEWVYFVEGKECHRIYHIDKPQRLYFRPTGTTHRIIDELGIAHCIPAPGQFGCVLRWYHQENIPEVQF